MKLGNKGMTLIELLISIVLMGTVLVFLFQLMNDLKYETDNNDFAYNNQINRTEAIYKIESDLKKNTLLGIEDVSSNNLINLKFHYKYASGEKIATLSSDKVTNGDEEKYYLRYTNFDGDKYSWEVRGGEISPCGKFTYYFDNLGNNYYFKLNLYVYTDHDSNKFGKNNAIDDFEITYSGAKSDLVLTNQSYLINNASNHITKNIGTCTN